MYTVTVGMEVDVSPSSLFPFDVVRAAPPPSSPICTSSLPGGAELEGEAQKKEEEEEQA